MNCDMNADKPTYRPHAAEFSVKIGPTFGHYCSIEVLDAIRAEIENEGKAEVYAVGEEPTS